MTEEIGHFTPLSGPFTVGGVPVMPARNRIGRGACARTVQPRVMELLCLLAAAPGRTFSRSELIEHVWQGVVVGPAAIDRTVCWLRKALGDCARRPDYIETVRKRGIRLMAPVAPFSEDGDAAGASPEFSLRMTSRQLLPPGMMSYARPDAAAFGFRFVNHELRH